MLTPFQRTYIQQLVQQPYVKHLCMDYLADDYEFERALTIVFVGTDNKAYAHRLGRKRLLSKITGEGQ